MKRTLVLCDDTWHPSATVRLGLAVFRDAFGFEWREQVKGCNRSLFEGFPLVVLAKSNAISSTDSRPWVTAHTDHVLGQYVREGGRVVVVHSGIAGYRELPGMCETLGGVFTHHPAPCPVTLNPLAPGHPICAGVKAFTITDEHYFVKMHATDAQVFLESRSEHGVQSAGWTHQMGAGRVCVLTPGHTTDVWLNPQFQQLLQAALAWAIAPVAAVSL